MVFYKYEVLTFIDFKPLDKGKKIKLHSPCRQKMDNIFERCIADELQIVSNILLVWIVEVLHGNRQPFAE